MVTELDFIRDAVSEDRLLNRAVNDAVAAVLRRTVGGLSVADAITALDRLREELEGTPDDRPRPIIRIRIRRT